MVYRWFFLLMFINLIAAMSNAHAAEPSANWPAASLATSNLDNNAGIDATSRKCLLRALSAISSYFFNGAIEAHNLEQKNRLNHPGHQVINTRGKSSAQRTVERSYLTDAKYSVDVLDDGAVLTWSYKI